MKRDSGAFQQTIMPPPGQSTAPKKKRLIGIAGNLITKNDPVI
jgi:hypothetical protein